MAAQETAVPDPQELKKRARRRLIGSIALALAAVVVLPMVMDTEPRPVGQDIQVRIPSQESEFSASKTYDSAAGKRVAAVEAGSNAGVASAVSSAPVSPVMSLSPALNPPPAEAAAPTSTAKSDTVLEKLVKTPAKADVATKAGEKTGGKPASKLEEARASAALEGKAGSDSGRWVVQLGAYQNAGNVKILLAKIKEMNLPVYTEKLETPQGARIRVRAGPFATKDAAEKAQSRIHKIGVAGSVALK